MPVCESLEEGINAILTPNKTYYQYNDVVEYTCLSGYLLSAGSSKRVCNVASGDQYTWSGKPAVCIRPGELQICIPSRFKLLQALVVTDTTCSLY